MSEDNPIKELTFDVVSGTEGPCLAINNHRVSGPKPWGGGTVLHSFKAKLPDVEQAVYGRKKETPTATEVPATAREILEALYCGGYDHEHIDEGAYSILVELCDTCDRLNDFQNSQCADLLSKLSEARRRGQAFVSAIQRHYDEMSSMCFICYSCVNEAARRIPLDGTRTYHACAGCGNGKPKWQFDVDRFSGAQAGEESQ